MVQRKLRLNQRAARKEKERMREEEIRKFAAEERYTLSKGFDFEMEEPVYIIRDFEGNEIMRANDPDMLAKGLIYFGYTRPKFRMHARKCLSRKEKIKRRRQSRHA